MSESAKRLEGKVAIVTAEHPIWNINQALTLFRPSDRITTGWLYYVLCGGENIAEIEDYLREGLKEIEEVKTLHGKGGLLGIEFAENCKPTHQKLLENKIITGTSSHPNVLRLLPPLCVKKVEIDLLLEVLRKI